MPLWNSKSTRSRMFVLAHERLRNSKVSGMAWSPSSFTRTRGFGGQRTQVRRLDDHPPHANLRLFPKTIGSCKSKSLDTSCAIRTVTMLLNGDVLSRAAFFLGRAFRFSRTNACQPSE